MSSRRYHHGNLREALLAQAEATVRERGVAALSLRELAREVGVSHAAPRRHFADRQALLDALAVAGFERLGGKLHGAASGADADTAAQLRALARAYIAFATADPDLLDLMFAGKHGNEGEAVEAAAQLAFGPVLALIVDAQQRGAMAPGDPERVGLIQLATIQGIASLLNAGMVSGDQLDELVEDAVAQFLAGAGARVGR